MSQAGVKLRSGRIRSVGARADDADGGGGRRKSVDSQNGDKLRSFVRSGAERGAIHVLRPQIECKMYPRQTQTYEEEMGA